MEQPRKLEGIGTCDGLAARGSGIWRAEHLGLGGRRDPRGAAVQEAGAAV